MHVGAIITIPNPPSSGAQSRLSREAGPIAQWELLGASVLDRTIDRMRVFGITEVSVIAEQTGEDHAAHGQYFWDRWEANVARYVNFGVKVLLLARVGAHVELDYADFFRFHRDARGALTEVYGGEGALDLVAIDAGQLGSGSGTFRSRLRTVLSKHTQYPFLGYSNRLKNVDDFRRLAKDALTGRAALHPIGKEVAPDVWVGQGAEIDSSVEITGPAYIGKGSRVRAGVKLQGASSIERHCEIDCGTCVEDSCILPKTYVGPGLNVKKSVVLKNIMFHVGRQVGLQFHDRRLLGMAMPRAGWLQSSVLRSSERARGPAVQ